MKYSQPYHDAVAAQRVIMERLGEATDKDVALLTSSFAKLEMLKLRLRMKPAPKPIDTTKQTKRSVVQGIAPEEPS